jgi:hypothetical protein
MQPKFNPEALRRPLVAATTLALAAGLLAVGETTWSSAPGSQTLERCFDEPLPAVSTPLNEVPPNPGHPLDLEVSAGGYIERAYVKPPSEVLSTVEQAAVEVDHHATEGPLGVWGTEGHGSGFVTTDPAGNEVVVTAAHVVVDKEIGSISVQTAGGDQTAVVTGGCYVLENAGKFVEFPKKDDDSKQVPVDTDLAVLILDHPLTGVTPLTVAKENPRQGDWGYAVNYQGDSDPEKPGHQTEYPLLVTQSMPGYPLQGMTGLRELPTPPSIREVEDGRVTPGASGGAVADPTNGSVWAITVGGTLRGMVPTAEDMRPVNGGNLNLTGPGANDALESKQLVPGLAYLVGATVTQAALHSPQA